MIEAGDGGDEAEEANKPPKPGTEREKQTEQQQQQPQEEGKHEGHKAGRSLEGSTTTRAFGALSLAEEAHLMIAKAHLAVAADCRRQLLASTNVKSEEVEKVAERFDQLWEELRQNLDSVASREAISHAHTMMQVALVPKLWDDRDFTMKVIKAGGAGVFMGCRNPDMRDDKEMLLLAVASDPTSIIDASDTLKADREVWLAALQSRRAREKPIAGLLGGRCSRRFLGDKEIMALAVGSDPLVLEIGTAEVQADRDVVLAALRAQTPTHVAQRGRNVLTFARGLFRDDKEVMLEAARSGAAILQDASDSLKMDKAFMLRATRCVPAGEQNEAYNQVHESVWRSLAWKDWMGAARSVLALPGDHGPILTVRLLPPIQPMQQQSESMSSSAPRSCEVAMFSGASFTCELPASFDEADGDWEDDDDSWGDGDDGQPDPDDNHLAGDHDDADEVWDAGGGDVEDDEEPELEELGDADEAASQPAPKRRRVDATAAEEGKTEKEAQKDGQSLPRATVAQLARVVLMELHRQGKVDPPPKTIFLAFLGESEDGESTVATAWDWNRLVNDFL